MRGRQGQQWNLDEIKKGIETFHGENGRYPKAWDFDLCGYLPSARSIQRSFGGLERLRQDLGYKELNYTKGDLRSKISKTTWASGLSAEDILEEKLTLKFGEPFVHTQRRYYKKLRNRYDFFIYHVDGRFGVDVFTTSRSQYIGNNVRHKLLKYKDVPRSVTIFFVVCCRDIERSQVLYEVSRIKMMTVMSNIKVVHEEDFMKYIENLEPLKIPLGFKAVL